jgi:uncharacterized spore protein YtfJ
MTPQEISKGKAEMTTANLIEQIKDLVTGSRVFGEPYEKNGVTVIPAANVRGGGGGGGEEAIEQGGKGGGGGFGLVARPVGAFVIKGENVSWIPAIDVNRIILGAQILVIVAILSWRSVAKARAKDERRP